MTALGIDAGASSTRWLLLDAAGAPLAEGQGPPISGHLFEPAAREAVLRALEALCAGVAAHGAPGSVVAGVTGLSAGSPVAELLAGAIADRFALKRTRVTVLDDMAIAYRGAFAPGEGILVYAGTGSIAYHLAADGRAERAGGHGYLIDDAGGGFWIGRAGLRAMVRARDMQQPDGPLAQALCERVGAASWDAMRAYVYGGGRAAVAGLVPAVVTAAEAGDRAAIAIMREAGRELARLGRVMLRRVGERPVALTGGVASASPLLFAAFRDALPPGVQVRRDVPPPVEAAARLAFTQRAEG